MLYHVSEVEGIAVFEPRRAEVHDAALVWAIHERRLHNYLLPRDCPRVTYCAKDDTTPTDVEQFLGASRAVVAVEHRWFDRMQSTRLFCYQLPAESFRVVDHGAGYYVSDLPVVPRGVQCIEHPMRSLFDRGVELRFLPDLVAFSERVVASSLQYSLIRMRNAGSAVERASLQ